MEQYSIRVNQLKKLKISIFFKLFLLIFINGAIFVGLYFFYHLFFKTRYLAYVEDIISTFQGYGDIAYFVICGIITFIIAFIFMRVSNKKYKQVYLDYLINECKLDEIYLLNNKIASLNKQSSYLSKIFKIKKVRMNNSFADASTKFSLSITNVSFIDKNKKNRNGVLFAVQYDQEKPGFLQITKDSEPSIEEYEGKEVVQYGFSLRSVLKDYHMFSTLGSSSYQLEKNEFGQKLILISLFFKKSFELVFDNDKLFILIYDYQIKLVDNLLSSINHNRFSDKIAAIKRIHKYFFDLIKMFDVIFITKI